MATDDPDQIEKADRCLRDIDAITQHYLDAGLDPRHVLASLASVTIKVAHEEPEEMRLRLEFFAEIVRAATDVKIV